METTQKKKGKKEKTLAGKIVMGINLMTISLLMALGIMVFFREKSVNDIQFTENLGNIMRLTDTTISAFLNGSDAELSLLGGAYVMAKNEPDAEERIVEYESNFVENNDTILAASISLESGESYYYPQDYAPADPREENWYIEAVDYDGAPRFSTLHELSDGKLAFTASKTITDEYGDMIGVAAYEVDARLFGILLGDSTSMGDISMRFFPEVAPLAVNNFIALAKAGRYEDTIFHRVINGFMIQGGDYTNFNGTGGESIYGDEFDLEIAEHLSNIEGSVAMANRGPGTNGSQFYINQVNNTYLDGGYTVFAQVFDGMDVVNDIAQVDTDMRDKPVSDVVLESIEVYPYE